MRDLSLAGITAATLIAASLSAAAADLPPRPDYKAPAVVPLPVPVNHWAGCYVGGNVGVARGRAKIEDLTGAGSVSPTNDGFAVGGQIGCDYQAGNWVFGIRNLGDWSNLDKRGGIVAGPFNGYSVGSKSNWVDLLTARAGYAVQPIWLLYFQGGAAWRNSDVQLFNPAGTQAAEVSKTRTGWTIGAGSEYKFAPNWSAFVEYNYAEFGKHGVSFVVPAVGTFTGNAKTDVQMVLTGVNWRF